MIFFDKLDVLCSHIEYLKKKMKKEDVYIVGGAIRDILLGIDEKPLDIDVTTKGNPETVYENIEKENTSIFKTDKFGTITILPRQTDIQNFFQEYYHDKEKQLQYEITPLRREGQYEDFRHPGEIEWTDDLVEDSRRRDFTINCIYFSYISDFSFSDKRGEENVKKIENFEEFDKKISEKGHVFFEDKNLLVIQHKSIIDRIFEGKELNYANIKSLLEAPVAYDGECQNGNDGLKILIDPYFGMQDLMRKNISAVDEPDNRFQEDALRIIRAVRLLNILNKELEDSDFGVEFLEPDEKLQDDYFDFAPDTRKSMKKNYMLVRFVAKERIKDEMMKIFTKGNPFGGVVLFDEMRILGYLFPSLVNTKGNEQPTRFHAFDTYTHTLLSLVNFQELSGDYLARFGALYHDVGKPDQYYFISLGISEEEKKKMHGSYIYHTNLGVEFAQNDFERLGFSRKEIDEICWYVKYHMVPGEILSSNIENIPKKLKKRMSSFGYRRIKNLIDIAKADRLGQYNPLQSSNIKGLDLLHEMLEDIYSQQGEFSLKDMAVNGNDIIKNLKISPGPKVGEYLQKALDRVLEDPEQRNYKEKIIEFLETQKD